MPTRRGPGRPPNPWRPRKIVVDYIAVSEGHHKPMTRRLTIRALGFWEDFLRRRGVDSDAVTIHDYIAWTREQIANGFSRTDRIYNVRIRAYYKLKGSADPGSKWSKLAAEVRGYILPKPIGKKNPYKPMPLQLLPKVLEAARHVEQHERFGRKAYSESFPVVATFLYGGGRAQWYGITDEQVEGALKKRYIELFVKEGEYVHVPVHDRLLEIWRGHLDRRDFTNRDARTKKAMFFRHGRDPYTYQEGSKDWRGDDWAARSNDLHVARIFAGRARGRGWDCVERRLEEGFQVREDVSSHRFRKSVATYMSQYGYTDAETRLQLAHGAATITQAYQVPFVLELQKKLSLMDLGSAEWVAAHDPPTNLFAGGNGVDQGLVAQLLAENRELRKKLDEFLQRKGSA